MDTTIDIDYLFTFSDGAAAEFPVSLDPQTLLLVPRRVQTPPAWAELERHRCSICPLPRDAGRWCPIAANLADIVEEFKEYFSTEEVHVTVRTAERTYARRSSLQEGLSSLIGIIMVTSGCPVMERLKPMVRFHLPFATLEETEFRMISMYLVAQYLRQQRRLVPDWDLVGLKGIYADVEVLNRSFAARLHDAAEKDANINALVKLDCFAKTIPLAAARRLHSFVADFASYLT
ncbi:MAG TPA: hypothetical protein VI389_01115 [Geobacteraceae bacterium]